jgi:hypothetical protein
MAGEVISQLSVANLSTWRYRYAVWVFDTVTTDLKPSAELVSSLLRAVLRHALGSNRLLSHFLTSFRAYTSANS